VDVVFHAAAQAGVRASWGSEFGSYLHDNLAATQRLLEAAVGLTRPPRIVYSSSSSVYGNAERYPTSEDDLPAPHSPYGVTKLAAEHLCRLYGANLGLHTVSLRYFTVYGPRQRPDMAFHRLCEAALGGEPFPLLGDGSQIRDFTFVRDVVRANLLAASAEVPPGTCVNVAGGKQVSLAEVIQQIGSLTGVEVPLVQRGSQRGDVVRTGGSTTRARQVLGWGPEVSLETGLVRQLEDHARRAHLRG
jgi:nucleoside-diphosphate-sugar epimerase